VFECSWSHLITFLSFRLAEGGKGTGRAWRVGDESEDAGVLGVGEEPWQTGREAKRWL
jgi:hypothetical protein